MAGIGDRVQSSFGHDGWDPPQDYGEYQDDGGGGGGGGDWAARAPARFKVPEPDENPLRPGEHARKRFMIIGPPFYMWEHGLFKMPNVPRGIYTAICLQHNKILDECPLCQDKRWPSYGAYFTVIDLGFVTYSSSGAMLHPEYWTDRKGKKHNMQFRRRVMVAKKGGKDNPGQLAFFEDQRNRRGDLTGCVYDTMRTGRKKAVMGDVLEFVERVGRASPSTVPEMRSYLQSLGATDEALDWTQKSEVCNVLTNEKQTIEEDLFTRVTTARMMPLLYSPADMRRWLGQETAEDRANRPDGRQGGGGPSQTTGTTTGADYDDDQIPF